MADLASWKFVPGRRVSQRYPEKVLHHLPIHIVFEGREPLDIELARLDPAEVGKLARALVDVDRWRSGFEFAEIIRLLLAVEAVLLAFFEAGFRWINVAVARGLPHDFVMLRQQSDFLPDLAGERLFESFAHVHASLRKLPRAGKCRTFAHQQLTFRSDEKSGDIGAKTNHDLECKGKLIICNTQIMTVKIFILALVKSNQMWESSGMMKTIICAFVLGAGSLAMAQGTNNNNNNNTANNTARQDELEARVKELETPSNTRFWQCNINGGEIMVAVDRIGSISKTQYLLDGGLLCTEVTIDTLGGQSLTRIYHVVPATEAVAANAATKIVDRAKEVLDNTSARAGSRLHEMVQKSYPTTTHAHTVEFRVMQLQDLEALYSSLKATWTSGKGRTFTIR